MEVAVYCGCVIPTIQYGYEMSVRETMPQLDVELVDLDNASCCGTPVQSVNMFTALYLAARNLAIAEKTGLKNLLLPCNGCYLSLSEAKHLLSQDETAKEQVNGLLAEENLHYKDSIKIWHTIDLLHDFIREEKIRKAVEHPLADLKLAVHYGCHILRPSTLQMVDDPEDPRKMSELTEWLGARSVPYPEKLDCCGAMLLLSHPDAAFTFSGLKLKAVQDSGADALVVACPSCQMMFDMRQKSAAATVGAKISVPVLYFTQLLGIAMGIDTEELGLHLNRSPIDEFLEKAGLISSTASV
ncbi:MAG: CoB--CoM heterodisulfide reductase iron-sulfur subunit B family protein [Candidatus Bathyarchaeota archaeon]|nr:MAG: CoB--CoM heterodisulfide reductase iron-sulfur subunit B family protein [Candidatus Bathyarchaeota archaeon]